MLLREVSTKTDEALLSLVRSALFFADVLAVQRELGERELISPEVEFTITHWLDDNYNALTDAGQSLLRSLGQRRSDSEVTLERVLEDLQCRLPLRTGAVAR